MKINIPHVAQLANLPITQAEEKTLEKQLSETLAYVDILNEIDTTNTQPTNNVTGLENVMREDNASASLPQEDALANTTEQQKGFFKVPAILDYE